MSDNPLDNTNDMYDDESSEYSNDIHNCNDCDDCNDCNDYVDIDNTNNTTNKIKKSGTLEDAHEIITRLTNKVGNKKVKIAQRKISERIKDLKRKQLDDINADKRMRHLDFVKIAKYVDESIFEKEKCALWTNGHNKNRGYVNFYFKNQKKVALHRLLFVNFVDSLTDDVEYIKYSCGNKGVCCNINHMTKYKYNKKKKKVKKEKVKKPKFKLRLG
jgi:hypothetical protein